MISQFPTCALAVSAGVDVGFTDLIGGEESEPSHERALAFRERCLT